MAADRLVDAAAGDHLALNDGVVLACEFAARQLGDQPRMRGERQGDHQQPRCVLVEPMDDTGTRYRRSLWKVIQQSVLQRARTLACAGVHGQTRWLVDDCDRLVEMHDFDRDVRSEEHTSELKSLMRTSYAVFCCKK